MTSTQNSSVANLDLRSIPSRKINRNQTPAPMSSTNIASNANIATFRQQASKGIRSSAFIHFPAGNTYHGTANSSMPRDLTSTAATTLKAKK